MILFSGDIILLRGICILVSLPIVKEPTYIVNRQQLAQKGKQESVKQNKTPHLLIREGLRRVTNRV